MNRARVVAAALLVVGVGAGTMADRPTVRAPIVLGGFRVLAADFHLHSSMWSDGALTPWGLVLEAERQGLDAIAITGHNEVGDSRIGRWFSMRVGGPLVLLGQEILAPGHHVIAVGVTHVVDSRQDVAHQIDEVHRQGGVAIAAHPIAKFWPGFDAAAMARLDGSEVCHPLLYEFPDKQRDLEAFAARTPMAAIGSSDFHGVGRMGDCRTYVFVRDATAAGVIDALRAHRTVVYGPGGTVYGDPTLVALAASRPELRLAATVAPSASWLDWISRVCGVAGFAVALVAAPAGRGPVRPSGVPDSASDGVSRRGPSRSKIAP